jgi:transcriptional regulator with XRE-family HTH domain
MENKIGSNIRRLREEKGWNLRELSDRAEVNYQQLSKIERNITTPGLDLLRKLAKTLDAPLTVLLGEENEVDNNNWVTKEAKAELAQMDEAEKLEALAALKRINMRRKTGNIGGE